MKLSISNIGWNADDDPAVYGWMKGYGYSGLEIAPTRIFPKEPYSRLEDAKKWSEELRSGYGFVVPSMQSIWYGRQERLFGSQEERQILIDHTKRAIDFAETVGCGNLVFGCPRNRTLPDGGDASAAISFFKEIGDYAAEHKTVVAMEANPRIYNTNYINDTALAIGLIKEVDSPGFRMNLDVGTMIENGETIDWLLGEVHLINHVHISEPGLKPIVRRDLHRQLRSLFLREDYQGFVSIEMGKTDDMDSIREAMEYVKEVFE